jgi:excisionase family DNA binding protein
MITTEEVLAVKTREAAKRLSVTPMTIRRLIDRGLLKPCRGVRHLLIPVSELQRFLNEASK